MSSIRVLTNPQASIIDVLATLFVLSCTKVFINSLLIFRYSSLTNITAQPPVIVHKVLHMDAGYSYLGTYYIVYMVIAALMLSLLAAIFLLLSCYPIKLFRRALSFIIRSNSKLQYLNTLVEKLQGHYKDGTNGTQDLRIFSVLYLVLRVILALSANEIPVGRSLIYTVRGVVLLISSVAVLVVCPYKAEYLSAYDGLLLSLLGIQCFLINLKVYFMRRRCTGCLWMLAVTMALPQLALMACMVKVMIQFVVGKCRKKRAQDGEICDTDLVTGRDQNLKNRVRDQGNNREDSPTEKSPLLKQ